MSDTRQLYLDFDAYVKQGNSTQSEKAENWKVAIGLQQVDRLKTSDYLKETALQHIEGNIDIAEAKKRIFTYYQSKVLRTTDDSNLEEADKVAANIAQLLSTRTLNFSVQGFASVHRNIFQGVFKFAGQFRDYDITKREWILDGDTVSYASCLEISQALDYDINQEKKFSYATLNKDQIIEHIGKFVSGLWQIHAFGEGNTRTTAVFLIQYLRSIGYSVNNDLFAEHSWYFRNALVRANYKNARLGIDYNYLFLERFLRNLLLGEQNLLKNRYLHINLPEDLQKEWQHILNQTSSTPSSTPSCSDPVKRLILAVGNSQLSVKEMMALVGLKDRMNFLDYSLNPAIHGGWITMLYPESPKHPRQKYLLTVKGIGFLNEGNL